MKAIGNNLIVKPYKAGVTKTKGGLFLAEKQREDIRYRRSNCFTQLDHGVWWYKSKMIIPYSDDR
jgi:hypothetical protein